MLSQSVCVEKVWKNMVSLLFSPKTQLALQPLKYSRDGFSGSRDCACHSLYFYWRGRGVDDFVQLLPLSDPNAPPVASPAAKGSFKWA